MPDHSHRGTAGRAAVRRDDPDVTVPAGQPTEQFGGCGRHGCLALRSRTGCLRRAARPVPEGGPRTPDLALTHRLQILIDDERYERVRAVARQRGTSVANVIREALDRGLPATQRRRAAAARRILDAAPMEVGDLLAELDELRGRHA